MLKRLPEFIEPLRMAEGRRVVQGAISLSDMKRLQPLLLRPSTVVAGNVAGNAAGKVTEEDTDTATVELEFSIDASGQANITGSVSAQLTIQCQRCMQPMRYQIDVPVSLAIIKSEKQVHLIPEHYEPLLVEDDSLLLSELVEDELLLAMPAVPLHDAKDCRIPWEDQNQSVEQQDGITEKAMDSERKNPFAALEQLRGKVTEAKDK